MVFEGLFETEHAPVVDIHLSQYTYIPGQSVSGQVSLQLSKSYRYSDIIVEFNGTMETTLGKRERENTLYYFHDSILLFKDEKGEKLAVGEHIFPFTFTLPFNLPDTLEMVATTGSRCRIKYWIQLKISNPSLFRTNVDKEMEVLVFTPYNGPPLPVSIPERTKTWNWLCLGSSGTISWTVKLDTSVWRAGEVMHLSVFVDNRESSHGTKGAYAQLTEHVVLMVPGSTEMVRGIMCTAETSERVSARQTGLLTMQMQLPANLQSSCQLDSLMCSYFLNVYIDIPTNTDPVIQMPITICKRKNTNEVVIAPPSHPIPSTIVDGYKAPVYSIPPPAHSPPAYEA